MIRALMRQPVRLRAPLLTAGVVTGLVLPWTMYPPVAIDILCDIMQNATLPSDADVIDAAVADSATDAPTEDAGATGWVCAASGGDAACYLGAYEGEAGPDAVQIG